MRRDPETSDPIIDERICEIIARNGFEINVSKTGIFEKGCRQTVTGIVVNQKCNFSRNDYRCLRSLFHWWKSRDAESAARRYVEVPDRRKYEVGFFDEKGDFNYMAFSNHVRGLLSYYMMIEHASGCASSPLRKLWDCYHDLTGKWVPEMSPERSVFMVDTLAAYRRMGESELTDYGKVGTCFLVEKCGLLSAAHCFKDLTAPSAIYDDGSMATIGLPSGDLNVSYERLIRMNDLGNDWILLYEPDGCKKIPGLRPAKNWDLQRGQKVIAYGYAEGEKMLRRIEARIAEVLNDEVVVDRAYISGMSGGPVLNGRGEVIGVITKGSSDGAYDRDGRFLVLRAIPPLVACLNP